MDKKKLLALKDEIEGAKTTVAELNGQLKSQMQQLKEIHGCNSVEEAEKKVKKMTESIEKLDEQITTGLTELEEQYDG